jgi:hypothetical protein
VCVFCNYESSVCATNFFGVNYGRFGQEVSTFDGFQYIEGGRDEEVVLTSVNGQCRVTVDDLECSSCETITCIDDTTGFPFPFIEVRCENVPDGSDFGGCDRNFVDTGVLEVATDFEFHTCIRPRSSEATCVLEIEAFALSESDPICECAQNEFGGHTLTCVEKGCLYCNAERSVCGYSISGKHFGRLGQDMGVFNGFQYVEGREDSIIFAQVLDPSDARECVVSAGDDECESCDIISCGGQLQGLDVECENLEDGGSFNTCAEAPVDTGLLEYFSFREFLECIEVQDPIEYCQQQKGFYELVDPDAGTICSCEAVGDGAKLSCADTKCQFCNQDETVCKINVAYGAEIAKLGYFVSTFDTSDYVVGRSERVVMEQTFPFTCRVTIDGQECESCDHVRCDDQSLQFVIQCENVQGGETYFGCNDSGSEVFAHLSDASFGVCHFYDGTFPPTAAPTIGPPTIADDLDDLDENDVEVDDSSEGYSMIWFYVGIMLQVFAFVL